MTKSLIFKLNVSSDKTKGNPASLWLWLTAKNLNVLLNKCPKLISNVALRKCSSFNLSVSKHSLEIHNKRKVAK